MDARDCEPLLGAVVAHERAKARRWHARRPRAEEEELGLLFGRQAAHRCPQPADLLRAGKRRRLVLRGALPIVHLSTRGLEPALLSSKSIHGFRLGGARCEG